MLAALDEKDYPEPEHLQAIFRASIENGVKNQISNLQNIISDESSER